MTFADGHENLGFLDLVYGLYFVSRLLLWLKAMLWRIDSRQCGNRS